MNTIQRVTKIIVEHLGVDENKVVDNANINDDLGADSLDAIELCMAVEEEFKIEITDDEISKIKTVDDIVKLVDNRTEKTDV